MNAQYPRFDTVVDFKGTIFTKVDRVGLGHVSLTQLGGEQPSDDRFEYLEKWNAWRAKVPLEECGSAYEIVSKATHMGLECQVISVADDGTALVYYLGGNTGQAEEDGFEQSDPGTFSKLVPLTELHGYYEEWRDLLFDLWREQAFDRTGSEVT